MKTYKLLSCLPLCYFMLTSCSDKVLDEATTIVPEKNNDGRYNILLIVFDQERYMECFPSSSNYQARKYIQQIGTTFQHHYACSNVSTASRAGIYTGMHITETGMLDNTNYPFQPDMNRNLKTIGDRLKNVGYYTAYKGKWHLSKHDTSLEEYGFSDWGTQGDRHGELHQGYEEDLNIANEATSWISDIGTVINENGGSFFLAVNFINPHDIMYYNETKDGAMETDIAPNDPLYKKTYPEMAVPDTWNEPFEKDSRPDAHSQYNQCWQRMTGTSPQNEAAWRRFSDYYYNCIQQSDNDMQTLLDLLKKKKLLNNTIIVMTSDHGEMQGAHGLKGKGGFMYENNIHVPLVVYHPEYQGGQLCKAITSHLDVTPTLLDFAGEKTPSELKGYSLLPQIKNPNTPSQRDTEGALFAFGMISMIDGDFESSSEQGKYLIDITNRGWVRGMVNKDYKFARYYSPIEANTPTSIKELYDKNDIEFYSLNSDEVDNMAMPRKVIEKNPMQQILIMEQNAKLNALISREIGVDGGGEGRFYEGGIMKYAKPHE